MRQGQHLQGICFSKQGSKSSMRCTTDQIYLCPAYSEGVLFHVLKTSHVPCNLGELLSMHSKQVPINTSGVYPNSVTHGELRYIQHAAIFY